MRLAAWWEWCGFLKYCGPVVLGLALACLVVISSPSSIWAQNPEVEWTVSFGTQEFDETLAAIADNSGIYVVGSTGGAFPVSRHLGGGFDAFISRFDTDGNQVWTQQFGTSGSDQATSVAADSSAVYIAGSTTGSFSGQAHSETNRDAFVSKTNRRGFTVWTRQFGTEGTDEARAIALDSSGIYVAGVVGGVSPGYAPESGANAFVRKYELDGNLAWDHQFGTTGSEDVFGIVAHGSGIYIVGTTTAALAGDEYFGGNTDVFIRKYNSQGHEQWTRQAGTLGSDLASGVAVGPSSVYLAGTTSGTFPRMRNYGGGRDIFLISYDFDGNELLTRQYGTEGSDEAAAVVSIGRDVFISGSTSGTMPGHTNAGDNLDAFLVSYNARGTRTGVTQLGTPDVDRTQGVATYLNRLYLVGNIEGDFPNERDGFVTSLVISGPGAPEPVVPTPTPAPTETPAPTPLPTLSPSPTPTQLPVATPATMPSPTPSPSPTEVPSPTPLPGPTATAVPTGTPAPTSTPTLAPTATTVPTPTVEPLLLPDSSGPPVPVQILVLGAIGLVAVIALIGVIRNW